jgi:hypothetical protein
MSIGYDVIVIRGSWGNIALARSQSVVWRCTRRLQTGRWEGLLLGVHPV